MKSKTAPPTVVITSPLAANNADTSADMPPDSPLRRSGKASESSPSGAPVSSRSGSARACSGPATPGSRRNGGHTASPSPAGRGPNAAGSSSSPGPGRTPQTRRREFSLSTAGAEKNGAMTPPNGSPRSRDNSTNSSLVTANSNSRSQQQTVRTTTRSAAASSRPKSELGENGGESCRKSSNSSQDSGIGRDQPPQPRTTTATAARADRAAARHTSSSNSGGKSSKSSNSHNNNSSHHSNNNNNNNNNNNPTILTLGPEAIDQESVKNRRRFESLLNSQEGVELGMVRVPSELLQDLIHQGDIHTYYDVHPVPVASGLFATVRKCTHKETGVEYAAKFSSRVRCGVDCTTEVLHEIALLSICSESTKIVHLKDVFQNQHEIVLVLEYAPGGDFQSVLDDDMVPFEQDVQGFMVQLLEALSFIHQRKIAHLDIKPQNIVLMSEFPNCEIKLCDLEVSRVIQDTEQIREIIGTPDYVAPEILQLEPITLSADIWSLGVLAYVLLTGFSPFGGDTDQETLRNITTAPLDFPAELFEGVSEDAKDFIAQCLSRDPLKRPSVDECFQHAWLSQNVEPPSPSPLMLKIPAPDHFVLAPPPSTSLASINGSGGGSGSLHHSSPSARRSCQTCRDKITERKRYLSKSREAIFEKVANSNLKKSLSKSRERLCDMRLTLSKSRDYLNESSTKMAAVRSSEKFYGLKSLSRSTEVLALTTGHHVKRRVNGAVSDISPVHLPLNPRTYLDSSPDDGAGCDFVILPGSSVLMSHADLMSLSSSSLNSCVIINNRTMTPEAVQLASTVESSGRTTPTAGGAPPTEIGGPSSLEATFPVASMVASSLISKLTVQTVVEETEDEDEAGDEDEEDRNRRSKMQREQQKEQTPPPSIAEMLAKSSQRRKSLHDAQNNSSRAVITAKEEKNNINYETKQSIMSRSASADGINQKNSNSSSSSSSVTNSSNAEDSNRKVVDNNNSVITSVNSNSNVRPTACRTAEVAVQVNLTRSCSSGNLVRRVQQEAHAHHQERRGSSAGRDSTAAASASGNLRSGEPERRLTRGFSHDDTLGEDSKRYSWREELERFRATKKPLGVSDLIDAFSSSSSQSQLLSRKVSAATISSEDSLFASVSSLDQLKSHHQRRGSLQIQIDSRTLATLTELAADREAASAAILHRSNTSSSAAAVKLQRRKSTSAIVSGLRSSSGGLEAAGLRSLATKGANNNNSSSMATSTVMEKEEKADSEKEEEEPTKHLISCERKGIDGEAVEEEEEEKGGAVAASTAAIHHQSKGRAYLEKVNERKRTWDYFEINHPKAISDKKLEQLKAKYTRRKTESCLATATTAAAAAVATPAAEPPQEQQVDVNSQNNSTTPEASAVTTTNSRRQPGGVPTRTLSMPLIQQQLPHHQLSDSKQQQQQLLQLRPLSLAWDPLTGASIGEQEEEDEEEDKEKKNVALVDSPQQQQALEEQQQQQHAVNRKSSSCYRLSGGHFADLLREEQIIPREEVLECFIDPFTGQFITSQVSKQQSNNKNNSKQQSPPPSSSNRRLSNNNQLNNSMGKQQLKVSLNSSSNNDNDDLPPPVADDGFGSLPATPTSNSGNRSLSLTAAAATTTTTTVADYAESIPTDDGIYTSTEEAEASQQLTASPSGFYLSSSSSSAASVGDDTDRDLASEEESISVISGEDSAAVNSCGEGGLSMAGGGGSAAVWRNAAAAAVAAAGSGAEQRPPRHQQRERAVANKICTGSFSRGIERFRSESPAAGVRSGSSNADS